MVVPVRIPSSQPRASRPQYLFLKEDHTAQHHSPTLEDVAGCCSDGGRTQLPISPSCLEPLCFTMLFRSASREPVQPPFPVFLRDPQCCLLASGFAGLCSKLRLLTGCRRQSRQRGTEVSCRGTYPHAPSLPFDPAVEAMQ